MAQVSKRRILITVSVCEKEICARAQIEHRNVEPRFAQWFPQKHKYDLLKARLFSESSGYCSSYY